MRLLIPSVLTVMANLRRHHLLRRLLMLKMALNLAVIHWLNDTAAIHVSLTERGLRDNILEISLWNHIGSRLHHTNLNRSSGHSLDRLHSLIRHRLSLHRLDRWDRGECRLPHHRRRRAHRVSRHRRQSRSSRIRRRDTRWRSGRFPAQTLRARGHSMMSLLMPRRFAFGLIPFSPLILRFGRSGVWSMSTRFLAFLNDQVIDRGLIERGRLTEPRLVSHRPHQIGFVANIGQIEAHSAGLGLSGRVIEPKRDRHQSLLRNVNRQQFL